MTLKQILVAALAAASVSAGVAASSAAASPDPLADARAATAPFHQLTVAQSAGYSVEVVDLNGIACIDDPAGGMGIHYVNPTNLVDPAGDASKPEAVIYEPEANGDMRLVALEYIVLKSTWEAAGNTEPPSLFGQTFTLVPAGNRYGLPDFYELHVWLWRSNPSGMFQDWNPKVTCRGNGDPA
jgi:hypothetical protein